MFLERDVVVVVGGGQAGGEMEHRIHYKGRHTVEVLYGMDKYPPIFFFFSFQFMWFFSFSSGFLFFLVYEKHNLVGSYRICCE